MIHIVALLQNTIVRFIYSTITKHSLFVSYRIQLEKIEKENEQLTVENIKHKNKINELTKSLKSVGNNQQELMQKVCMCICM